MLRCHTKRGRVLPLIFFASVFHLVNLHAYAQSKGLAGTDFTFWQQGTGPFRVTDHFISNQTGLVLSLYSYPEHLANFSPNFRGLKQDKLPFSPDAFQRWNLEYFCEPDYALAIFEKHAKRYFYLAQLRWRRSLYFDQANNRIFLEYRHHPNDGFNPRALGKFKRTEDRRLDTGLTLSFSWGYAAQTVDVTLSIENLSNVKRSYQFAAQDAAYMWFPNQAQLDLTSFLYSGTEPTGDKYMLRDGVPQLLAGTYYPKEGVFSGFRSMGAILPDNVTAQTSVGTAYFYLLVPPTIPIGYQRPDYQKLRDFGDLIAASQLPDTDLINRYVAFSLENVLPKQTCILVFQLVMGQTQPNSDLNTTLKTILDSAKP